MNWLVTATYHDYPSNFSNGTQVVNGLGSLFYYMNDVLGNLFGWMLLLSIAIISFLTLKGSGFPASKAFSAVSFVCTLLSVLLMMVGIVSFSVVMLCAIVTIFMALIARGEANIGL